MTDQARAAADRTGGFRGGRWPAGGRRWLAGAALLLAVAGLVPPLGTLAGRYAVAETIQFSLFAMVIPALAVLSAPGRRLGAAARLARARQQHPALLRSMAVLAIFAAVAVCWRLPPVIDALARHRVLALAELASLLAAGMALWLELVPSPPLRPRGEGLHRAVIGAFAMWLIWAIAYILGLATRGVFHAFRYPPGGPLSAVADQELATGVLWVMAAACFLPVIFIAALHWLRDSENVEQELSQLSGAGALPAVRGWGRPGRGSPA